MIVEIRTYRLKPGTAQEFLRVVREEALPLLEKFGLHVVDAGLSLTAASETEDAYLIRTFDSLEHRDQQEKEFYGSDDWRDGPRAGVMACIESYHTVVLGAELLADL